MQFTRRDFNRISGLAGMAFLTGMKDKRNGATVPVAVVKTSHREAGIGRAVALLGETDFTGENLYLKGNYNSPDPYPATTHPEALRSVVALLKARGIRRIALVERSGMGLARDILEKLGGIDLIRQLGIGFLPLEELATEDWQLRSLPGSHWENGIEAPRFLTQESCVVQICNLKTHRFGGQFSASLKNSIGLIAKYSRKDAGKNYMRELHASPHQCRMIAEVNQIYSPQLVVMDAIQAFISGGPEAGEPADSRLIAASKDRVALDAVGLAMLRHLGAQFPLNKGAVFDHPQIKRAGELGLGVQSAEEIRMLTDDEDSRLLAAKLQSILLEPPPE
jgi:uncharacterized protein (DUF362 family)